MIPSDLAARLRLLTESIVNPIAPVREIPADLPELAVGQRFTARVESTLPDGTFRALVAGRSLTLALPQPAGPGDTLDLVVAGRTPRLIVAESAEAAPARPSPAPQLPTLSRAGQIIGTLLAGEDHAPRPATIAGADPLLAGPPRQAALLAPALQQAIAGSGLFYEAHQALWVAGRYPAEALAREPQARHAVSRRAPDAVTAGPPAEAVPATESTPGAEPRPAPGAAAAAPAGLPAELQSLVQQQLDTAATQHIVWRGELWPGQTLHWEIEAEERHGEDAADAPAEHWTTTLRLTLPVLGEVGVVLGLSPAKVSLAMTAPADGAETLKRGLDDLAAAFAAAGLPPLSAGVESHDEPA